MYAAPIPANAGNNTILSSHPLTDNPALAGYLYVVLGGEQYESAAAMLDTDDDGRIGEEEIVGAFARYFTVPE